MYIQYIFTQTCLIDCWYIMDITVSMLQYVINHKGFILSNDAAEQRNVDLQVFREGVEVAHGSEIHHAIGGLLTVLNRYTAYKETANVGKRFLHL